MNTSSRAVNGPRAIVIAAIAVVGLAAVAVNAATSTDPSSPPATGHHFHHGPAGHFMHVLKQLNLSAEQKTQIKSIFDTAKPQFKALHESMRSNHDALLAATPSDADYPALIATEKANQAKMIDQMSAVKTQIYAVLTAAQIKQIPQIVAADKAKWQQHQQSAAPASPPTT
jgi:Spy/CpxP family protein refolding chaperone